MIPLALGLIFVLLYSMFGNIRDGLLMFTGVPFALSGGVLALWLRDIPVSISAAVGFIALSGVAVLNGLVMLAFIRDLREKGFTLDDAIQTGALSQVAPGAHDGAGGSTRIRSHGASHWHRCGSAAAAGDGGDRRHYFPPRH